MAFTPQLFIGIGKDQHFYTLRETFEHVTHVGGRACVEIWSFHHFNLSQNADEAIAKAAEFAEQHCLQLTSTKEGIEMEMREIHRATAEQLEMRRAAAAIQQKEWEERRAAEAAERLEKINSGIFVFGPYDGKKFEEAPRGYLSWMMVKVEEFEPESILRITAEAVLRLVPHLALPRPKLRLHFGKISQRVEVKVTAIRHISFWRDGFSGPEICHITTMVTEEGACLICFSAAFHAEEGQVLTIKATVKDHTEYKGQAQTVVQRVKIIEQTEVEKPAKARASHGGDPSKVLEGKARDRQMARLT